MKRIMLSVFMSMFLLGAANAQFSMLFEGGANYGKSRISQNVLLDHENIVSYYLAATPKFGITKNLKVIGEVQYSVEGASTISLEQNQSPDASYRQHFLRLIPGVQLDVIGPLSIIGGLNIGYAAVETLEDRNGNQVNSEFITLYKKSDFGLLVGLNFNFGGINIVAKYNYGLRDLNELAWTDREGNPLPGIDIKSRFLQVGVGYEFGL